jgi:hypothetical protein
LRAWPTPPRTAAAAYRGGAFTLVGLAVGAAALAWVVSTLDLAATPPRLRAAGLSLVLAFVPNLVSLAIDAFAWRMLLAAAGWPVPFRSALRIRMGAEAVGLLLPSGGILQEIVALRVLRRSCGVPVAEGLASLLARRFTAIEAHGLLLAAAAVLTSMAGNRGLPVLPGLIAAAALVLCGVGRFGPRFFAGRSFAARVTRALRLVPSRRLRLFTERHEPDITASQLSLRRLAARSRAVSALALLGFVLVLLAETGESFVMLRLLGSRMSFAEVLAFDPTVTLGKALFAVLPAGLGVQDAGYAAFLLASGEEDAAGRAAAFVTLKRAKDAVYCVAGLLALGLGGASVPKAARHEAARAGALRLRLPQPDDANA